jgi:hypothetical protein
MRAKTWGGSDPAPACFHALALALPAKGWNGFDVDFCGRTAGSRTVMRRRPNLCTMILLLFDARPNSNGHPSAEINEINEHADTENPP